MKVAITNTTFKANKMSYEQARYVDRELRKAKNVDIVCHHLTDRDGAKSALAMWEYLNAQGVNARIIMSQKTPLALGLRNYDCNIVQANEQEKIEELILAVETTKNDFVDGVDRDMLVVTVTPAVYSKIQNYIDSVPNSLTGLTDELFHRVKIFSNHRQTKGAICMIDGAVAQLVTTDEYDAEKIPLSNDIALELFFSKGTKAVMPDLIKYATI